MKQSTMEAYAEVDMILNLMDSKYTNKIPLELRQMFKEKKDKSYKRIIYPQKPLYEQNLKQETLSILAVLNYKYWCEDKAKKKELIKRYSENERRYQEEIRKRYNPDDIFKNKKGE